MSCFCNGLSVDCESSTHRYSQIDSDFESEYTDWYVSNKFTKLNETVDLQEGGVGFDRFEEFENEELYFIVPPKFRGNKVRQIEVFSFVLIEIING